MYQKKQLEKPSIVNNIKTTSQLITIRKECLTISLFYKEE